MQNVSRQAFQSNEIYALFKTFNPGEKINLLQPFKISPIRCIQNADLATLHPTRAASKVIY